MLDILKYFLCHCDWNICYIIYLDCLTILLHICLFWEVHFTTVIMPKKFGLTGTNIIGVIFYFFFGKMVEFSFAAIHNTKFIRGKRKALWLPEPE
jgi:hypothetical protein